MVQASLESPSHGEWYVAAVTPRSETLAQTHLRQQGFASFCPKIARQRLRGRRVEQILSPAFPGYLFVKFDRAQDRWRSINGTRGIRYLVGSRTDAPQPLLPALMGSLFERCQGDLMVRKWGSSLHKGQTVRILRFPYANHLARIEELDGQGRVQVLLTLLGQTTPLNLAEQEVELDDSR